MTSSVNAQIDIHSLTLEDFRNYTRYHQTFATHTWCLIGSNGSGKSNLLQALSYLTNTRTSDGRPNEDDLKIWATNSYLEGHVTGLECSIHLDAQGRAEFYIEQKRVTRKKYLHDIRVRSLYISAEEMNILYHEPARRRLWIDRIISLTDENYITLLHNYQKTLRQRNALLKAIKEQRSAPEELTYWNTQLSDYAQAIWKHRMNLQTYLCQHLELCHAWLQKDYALTLGLTHAESVNDQTSMQHWWAQNLRQEVSQGKTLIGPHLDDLNITTERSRRSTEFLSRGENKILLLGLSSIASDYIREQGNVAVLLLLDDIFSELDQEHIQAFLKSQNTSNLVLTTQPNHLPELPEAIQKIHLT